MNKLTCIGLAVLVVIGADEGGARAGGQYLPFRGVRPTGRGGAFVAGADDPNALWYNPAGLAEMAGGDTSFQLLIDAAYVGHSVDYTRIDSGGNTQPTVSNDQQLAPLPTIAAEFDLGKSFALGVGLITPYSSLDGYPENGAQRYSLVSQHGSILAIAEAAIGWKVNDKLNIGVGIEDMIASISSQVTFGTCPGQTVCAPEDPSFDALGQINAQSFLMPSGIIGAQLHATSRLTFGAAFQLPFHLSTTGTVKVRLPSSGFFNGSSVSGDQADVSTTFPAMARFGVQVEPADRWKIEVGFDWEMWSEQKDIEVTPKNIQVVNAAGVGMYQLGPIDIPRNFNDTYAARIGLEAQPWAQTPFTLRGGFVYETGAAPLDYLSVLTVDGPKEVVTLGAAWQFGRVRLDATLAHVFVNTMNVQPGTSCVPQINPIRSGEPGATPDTTCTGTPATGQVYVGDGSYKSSWNVVGVGMAVDY